MVLPDHALSSRIVEARTQLLLDSDLSRVSSHLVVERLRLGEVGLEWELDLSRIAEQVVASQRRNSQVTWDAPWLLTNIAAIARRLGDDVLADDVTAAMLRFADRDVEDVPRMVEDPATVIAWTEAMLVLATIAQRWRLTLDPAHPIEPQPLITLRTRHGVRATAHERHQPRA